MQTTSLTLKKYLKNIGVDQKQILKFQSQSRYSNDVKYSSRNPSNFSQGYQNLRKKNLNYKQNKLLELFDKISLRRKMYSFQVIKQFYLFPDQSISQNIQLDSYDRLLTNDEPIHTFVKIFETKEIQNIIWAFINLKAIRLKKKIQKFSSGVTAVNQKVKKRHQKHFFTQIQTYSIKIRPTDQVRKATRNQKNRILNQVYEKIQLRTPKYQETPQVVTVKYKSPKKITNAQQQRLRSRVIYPTQEDLKRRQQRARILFSVQDDSRRRSRVVYPTQQDLKRRQDRSRSYRNGQIKIIQNSPHRQYISTIKNPIQTPVNNCCNCSNNQFPGRTCIHIYGNCTISSDPHQNIKIHESHNRSPHNQHITIHESSQHTPPSFILNNSRSSRNSSLHNRYIDKHQQKQEQYHTPHRTNSMNRHQIQQQYNMDSRIDYMNKLEQMYKKTKKKY